MEISTNPAITDWFKEIFFLQRMEELRAESKKLAIRHSRIWRDCLTFCPSPEYSTYVLFLYLWPTCPPLIHSLFVEWTYPPMVRRSFWDILAILFWGINRGHVIPVFRVFICKKIFSFEGFGNVWSFSGYFHSFVINSPKSLWKGKTLCFFTKGPGKSGLG